MKRFISLCLLTLAAVLGLPGSVWAAGPTKIVFSWTDSFSGVPACTTTLTTNCVSSFTLTEPVTGFTTSISAVGGTATTNFGYTLTPLPPAGTYTYTLVAVEVYSGGTITSGPATATVTVPKSADVPVSFGAVLQ